MAFQRGDVGQPHDEPHDRGVAGRATDEEIHARYKRAAFSFREPHHKRHTRRMNHGVATVAAGSSDVCRTL